MKIKTIPSRWLLDPGTRLAARPYHSGARDALDVLSRMSTTPLRELTQGGVRGIFNGPRFARQYVEDPDFGVPLLSGADILAADLSHASLISRRQAAAMQEMLLKRGTTLVTSYGTVGRTAYVRTDMEGMVGSDNVMKIVPAASFAVPGYLFAFLSSKYGVPITTVGTTGGTVPFLPPERLFDLPVPRLSEEVERCVHELVEEAALLRVEGAEQIARTVAATIDELGLSLERGESVSSYSINTISSSQLNGRLDAPYHSRAAARAEDVLDKLRAPSVPLAEVVTRYFKPPMFKRIWVDGPSFGCQFISGVDAYRFQAESIRYVSHKTPHFDEFILDEGMVIFQAAGQIYGLFGQPLFVSGWLSGLFAADDLYRLKPYTPSDGGFIFAFLRTSVGQVLLKRQACGNSIPRVWDPHIRDMSVPWPDEAVRVRIGGEIIEAHARIERARVAEVEAVALVEHAIEEAT